MTTHLLLLCSRALRRISKMSRPASSWRPNDVATQTIKSPISLRPWTMASKGALVYQNIWTMDQMTATQHQDTAGRSWKTYTPKQRRISTTCSASQYIEILPSTCRKRASGWSTSIRAPCNRGGELEPQRAGRRQLVKVISIASCPPRLQPLRVMANSSRWSSQMRTWTSRTCATKPGAELRTMGDSVIWSPLEPWPMS